MIRKKQFLAFSFGVLAAGLILGLYVYHLFATENRFYISPPNSKTIFRPDPAVLPGVHGVSHFYLNSQGVRGDEFSSDQKYRILALGSSTTECLYLDYPKSWTCLLQEKLNRLHQGKIWVGNAGKSGGTSRATVVELSDWVPQEPHVDAILLMLGANDLLQSVCNGLGFYQPYDPNAMNDPRYVKQLTYYTFYVVPLRRKLELFSSLGLWTMGSIIKGRIKTMLSPGLVRQSTTGTQYVENRRIRNHAMETIDKTPDFGPGLAEYDRNLNRIIDLARAQHIRLILVTEPALWKSNMTPQENALLWMGWIKDRRSAHHTEFARFYSARVLAEGLAAYNQKMISVCKKRGVECIDLASRMNGEDAAFYDDCHFNEHGAKEVSERIFSHFISRLKGIGHSGLKTESNHHA